MVVGQVQKKSTEDKTAPVIKTNKNKGKKKIYRYMDNWHMGTVKKEG